MIGQTVSHYKILERLGGGGMGVVYKAEDTRLRRNVALKFLPPDLTRDEEAKNRFVHEAQAASALQHPNICAIHDIEQTDDHRLFIVMDCYEGESLKSRIANGQSGPEQSRGMRIEEALDIAGQVAKGLAKAHESGIVHRDIKCANIMIGKDGIVRIVDFGLAKLSGQTMLTKSGSTVGTAAYMSPEQARGEKVDHRTDIWSLGVVLYEMLTGQQPFASEYEQAMMYSILSAEPKPIEELRPEVPGNVIGIVQRAMEKEKEKRFQSATEMAEALRGEGKPQKKRMSRRKKRVLYSLALGIAIVATGVVLFFSPGKGEVYDSIAVLPAENLSRDQDQEAFVEGMTTELIAELGKIKALTPIAWQSVKKYKNTDKSVAEIAHELGVKAIVSMQCSRVRDSVRIRVSLIPASSQKPVFSNAFDREIKNVLALQSEIARLIVSDIRVSVTPQEVRALSRTRSVNPDAYEAYLKGRYFGRGWTEELLNKAIEYFQRSINLEPTYADAYAGLGSVFSQMAIMGIHAPNEMFPKSKNAVLKALEIDSTSASAHAQLAFLLLQDWNWSGSESEFVRALSLNPNSGAHSGYAAYLLAVGRSGEAVSEAKRALELDPLATSTNLNLGWTLYYARRHDESIAQLKKTLELEPKLGWAYMELGWNYAQKRSYQEAVTACNRAIELLPNEQVTLAGCGFVYGLSGKRAEAMKCLGTLHQLSKRSYVDPYNIAWLYDGLDDNNPTLEWLERAYGEHSASMYALKVETWTDKLRADPRFKDLLRRMNFPQ
jgi:eukaryotic-like serine/threonine-protein kinase